MLFTACSKVEVEEQHECGLKFHKRVLCVGGDPVAPLALNDALTARQGVGGEKKRDVFLMRQRKKRQRERDRGKTRKGQEENKKDRGRRNKMKEGEEKKERQRQRR